MRTIKNGAFGTGDPYNCQYDWPADCHVQCGGHGLVLTSGTMEKALNAENPIQTVVKNTSYVTAFFEAFPGTFIRGEGKTIAEAETKAWETYQRGLQCKRHEFERRGYTNGCGFCKHCNYFETEAFDPTTQCCVCGALTTNATDTDDNYYCEQHPVPLEKMHSFARDWQEQLVAAEKHIQEGTATPHEIDLVQIHKQVEAESLVNKANRAKRREKIRQEYGH